MSQAEKVTWVRHWMRWSILHEKNHQPGPAITRIRTGGEKNWR